MKKLLALLVALALLFAACENAASPSGSTASSDKVITALSINGLTLSDVVINTTAHTITATVPYGTVLTALVPDISFTGASIVPASGSTVDFSSPVAFTITAEDGSTVVYTITITVASESTPAYVGTWYKVNYGCELYALRIDEDGTFATGVAEDAPGDWDRGTYTVSGSQITVFNDEETGDTGGQYSFSCDGDSLVFSLISDSMEDRDSYVVGTWSSAAPATYGVSGRITLPADSTGKKYYVAIDSNDDGSDGMNYVHGVVDGSFIDYSLGGFTAGTYYLYGVIDNDDSWGDDDAGPVGIGDYWAFYDMSGGNPPDSATLVIAGDRTVNLSAIEFDLSDNTTPVADAGEDQTISDASTSTVIILDGSGSYDDEGQDLTYSWTFVSLPTESSFTLDSALGLSDADTATPSFSLSGEDDAARTDGTLVYTLELTVTDTMGASDSDTVTVTVDGSGLVNIAIQ